MAKAKKKKELKEQPIIFSKKNLPSAEISVQPYNHSLFLYIILAIGFSLYINTIFNEYAYDDGMAITDNTFTQKGFSGIGEILRNDTFIGVKGTAGELTGGRYRPLSVITFAIEKGLFGKKAWISHLINVLLFCILLYYLFQVSYRFLFKGSELKAFFSSLIFVIHPIHTEVVANIKSRDEIFSFLFLLISLYYFLQHEEKKKHTAKYIVFSCLTYFLALLSKENGITFLAIFPITYFICKKESIIKSIRTVLPYMGVAFIYLLLRFKIVGMHLSQSHELMNAPYLLASSAQAFATKSYVLTKYLYLLFIPYPLTYDYSFNEIPYIELWDIRSLAGMLVHLGLLIYALKKIKEREIISYLILFYLITISIVSNLIFDIGATMGERFLFQPSFSFALLSGIFLNYVYERSNNKLRKSFFIYILSILTITASAQCITRNMDWKNDYTLFMNDIKNSPHSAKVYVYAGVVMVKSVDAETDSIKKGKILNDAIGKFKKSIEIYPAYTDAYLNMGVAYSNLNDKEKAMECWEKANAISPGYFMARANLNYLSDYFLKKAVEYFNIKDYPTAIRYTEKSVRCNEKNALGWFNLGGYWMMLGDKKKAIEFWQKTLEIDPSYSEARVWLEKAKSPNENN